jgi:glucose-6-phosphate 1-dehydrogenase
MKDQKQNTPAILFIFGGSGDLTNRKLIPALYNLYIDNFLPEKFVIIGVGRTHFDSDDAYRSKLLEGVQQFSRRKDKIAEKWPSFAAAVTYHELDLLVDSTYNDINNWVVSKTKEWNEKPNLIYYLSVAPQLAPDIAKKLAEHKLCNDIATSRIVFENHLDMICKVPLH